MRNVKSAVASATFFDVPSNVRFQAIQEITASGSSWPRTVNSWPRAESVRAPRTQANAGGKVALQRRAQSHDPLGPSSLNSARHGISSAGIALSGIGSVDAINFPLATLKTLTRKVAKIRRLFSGPNPELNQP